MARMANAELVAIPLSNICPAFPFSFEQPKPIMKLVCTAPLLLIIAVGTHADPLPEEFHFNILGGQEPATNRSLVERAPWNPETGWQTAVDTGTRLWDDLYHGSSSDKKAMSLKEDHWISSKPWTNYPTDRWIGPMLLKFAHSTGISNAQYRVTHRGGIPKNQYLPEEWKTRYKNTYSPQNKLIICDNNEKATQAKEPPQLFWSDVVFAGWKEQCEKVGLPPSGLDYISRSHIINSITRGIIKHAYSKSQPGTPINEEIIWLPSGNTKEGFLALLGSPNGYGIAKFLLEHETALGRKTIASVVTQNVVLTDPPGERQEMVWRLDEVSPNGATDGRGTHSRGAHSEGKDRTDPPGGGKPYGGTSGGGGSGQLPNAGKEEGKQSPLSHPRKPA